MKKIKIETWLPVFPGFYSTIFEPDEDNEIDDINSQRESKGLKPADFDKMKFDYDDYHERVSKACVNFIHNELKDVFKSHIDVNYQSLTSPKEYNFDNDAINIEIIINKAFLDELRSYLTNYKKEFDTYIQDRYTSRPGFSSFHSNDGEVWLNEYFKEIQDNGHYLGAILEFVCRNEDINQDNMFDDICSEAYLTATNYDELIEGKV